MKRILLLAACLLIVFSLAYADKTITIKGSDTMVILGQRWAEHYMKTHEDAVIQVTGGGSGTGIAALINGSADIAQASRRMKPKEFKLIKENRGVEAVEFETAMDGLAVYVHESNPIESITIAELKQIYQNDLSDWADVGGPEDEEIVIYSRENNSGTYVYFKDNVLDGEDFSPYAQTLPGTAAIINAVSKDPNSIGYGGIGYHEGVRVIPVAVDENSEPIAPTEENVAEMKYPLARYLYWYTAGEPTGEIKDLLDWVLDPRGQELVIEVGYYPLPKSDTGETPDTVSESTKTMKAEQ